jgi:beta-galactosidase
MNRVLRLLVPAIAGWCMLSSAFAESPRERVSFNRDWRFQRGDPEWINALLDYTRLRPWLLASSADFLSASATKPQRPSGNFAADVKYATTAYDDSAWRKLDLPHDWGVEGPFRQDLDGNTAKLPWAGTAWYRKHFTLPAEHNAHYSLEIDGAMAYAAVWLNGEFVGGWPYGYASFALDLTPFLNRGGDNVIAIRLDNPPESSRWYPGGGIYRNVWLTRTTPIHVAHWGTTVVTPRITPENAIVLVTALVDNETKTAADVSVTTEVFEIDSHDQPAGSAVATATTDKLKIPPQLQASATQTLSVAKPKLWSIESPQRYVAVTTVRRGNDVVDVTRTPFGIRTVAFDPDRGFLLNGKVVRLQGVCDHHDLGALGAVVNVRALERQVEILRAFGCNAIRTSHNPPAPELLELCDRLGVVVFDEPFDCWAKGKNRNDYHVLFPDWHEQDMRAFIRRDRNHPSVVMWSIGNEVVEQFWEDNVEAWKLARELAGIIREEDRTRPISGAFNNERSGYNGIQLIVDAVGYNYRDFEYASFRKNSPTIPLFGSETASCVSSRGEYFFPVSNDKLDPNARTNFQVSSYDLSAPPWAMSPDQEWKAADGAPGYAGEFVWTGFDYLGEPTPYGEDSKKMLNFTDPALRAKAEAELKQKGVISVPSRSSYFGIVDLAGFPKDRFYLYQARWRPDLPMAHLLPHWTWPDRVGQVTPVHVYTSGDEAELFLNGRSLGRKKKAAGEYRLRWDDVKYEAGEVHVVAYKNGQKWAEDTVRTAGAAKTLTATADRTNVHADGNDLVFVSVAVTDDRGTLVPRANSLVKFSVTGPGEVIAVDNGDATSFEPFQASQMHAYNGRVLAIVRTREGQAGKIVVRAEAEGLAPAEAAAEAK